MKGVITPGATLEADETDTSAVEPLAGFTIGITAARRRDEFGAALERRGAKILYGPAIRIIPFADDTELLEATQRCLAAPLDLVVATTGIGFRGWMDAAHGWDLAEPLLETIAGLDDPGPRPQGPRRRASRRAARNLVAGIGVHRRSA